MIISKFKTVFGPIVEIIKDTVCDILKTKNINHLIVHNSGADQICTRIFVNFRLECYVTFHDDIIIIEEYYFYGDRSGSVNKIVQNHSNNVYLKYCDQDLVDNIVRRVEEIFKSD